MRFELLFLSPSFFSWCMLCGLSDFCDFFLIPDISRHRIPMECVCLWWYNKEAKRPDVDYRTANSANCNKYSSRMITRARKPLTNIPCFDDDCHKDVNVTAAIANATIDLNEDPQVKRVVLQKDDTSVRMHETHDTFPTPSKPFQILWNCLTGSLSIGSMMSATCCQNCCQQRKCRKWRVNWKDGRNWLMSRRLLGLGIFSKLDRSIEQWVGKLETYFRRIQF